LKTVQRKDRSTKTTITKKTNRTIESSMIMKARRQYNIISKIWREKNFNQNFAPCETCGKHGDALPDPLQKKTYCSVAGSVVSRHPSAAESCLL